MKGINPVNSFTTPQLKPHFCLFQRVRDQLYLTPPTLVEHTTSMGAYLVEASVAAAPDKALVLAVTKRMLYGEETPLVGVGLVYKPHYISTEPFCAAYMHLHVWHAAGSSV